MQVTSFQKALLGVAGAVGLAGGTAGLLLWRADRKDGEDASYRAKDMPVDEFVGRVLSDYDEATYPTPLTDTSSTSYDPDGVLTIGAEHVAHYDATLYREFSDNHDGYDEVVSAQRFLVTADADDDGHVTRAELRTAVDAYAGDDGKLSSQERRTVLVDEGLGEVVTATSITPRTSWDSNQDYERPIVAVADVVQDAFYDYADFSGGKGAVADGAFVIDRVQPQIPWDGRDDHLETGEIRSMLPMLTAIDTGSHGNDDGKVSREELAHWVADEFRNPRLSYGHVDATTEDVFSRLHGQVLGRIDADTLQGHAYLSTDVPEADLTRFYGGDLGGYLDSIKGVRAARGPVDWVPEPAKAPRPADPADQRLRGAPRA